MKDKRIVVCLKYFKGEMNPFDGAALECALETGAREIIALSMAPMSALNTFQGLTRLGVKCVFISDPTYAGSDTLATSYILAEAVKRLKPDFVFCGRQSVDGDTAQVPPMLAKRLGFPIRMRTIAFRGEEITLRNGETYLLNERTIVTFEKIRTLRFPSIFSKIKEVEIWDNQTLGLPEEKCGFSGSATKVIKSYESRAGRRTCRFIGKEDFFSVLEERLQKCSDEQVYNETEKLSQVYYVGDIENVAKRVAQKAVKLEISDKSDEEIAAELLKGEIKTVLWEDQDGLKTRAAAAAVLTGAGMCADCISFRAENDALVMTRPALGGNVTADIVCTGAMAFATVRTTKKDGADIIFSVGKGAINHIDGIKALAKKYGADICCSRIVADSGKLSYEQQVGLTGKAVCPKIYVAFGISGAVQHTCAITGAGTVIAVNTDRNAGIFDYADYGIVSDVEEFLGVGS